MAIQLKLHQHFCDKLPIAHLLLVQMGYRLLRSLWVWRRRTNRRPCYPPLTNPSKSSWTARPDCPGRLGNRMTAQYLHRKNILRLSSGLKNWLKRRRTYYQRRKPIFWILCFMHLKYVSQSIAAFVPGARYSIKAGNMFYLPYKLSWWLQEENWSRKESRCLKTSFRLQIAVIWITLDVCFGDIVHYQPVL